jgi:hypothetical protein
MQASGTSAWTSVDGASKLCGVGLPDLLPMARLRVRGSSPPESAIFIQIPFSALVTTLLASSRS